MNTRWLVLLLTAAASLPGQVTFERLLNADKEPQNWLTYSGGSRKHGGSPIWVTGSYDPEINLTFWGSGNPNPGWNGDSRSPGDNLDADSVVALDATTGKLKWHYQFTPADEFDWDSRQVPVLTVLPWQGKSRKVMLWVTRNQFIMCWIGSRASS